MDSIIALEIGDTAGMKQQSYNEINIWDIVKGVSTLKPMTQREFDSLRGEDKTKVFKLIILCGIPKYEKSKYGEKSFKMVNSLPKRESLTTTDYDTYCKWIGNNGYSVKKLLKHKNEQDWNHIKHALLILKGYVSLRYLSMSAQKLIHGVRYEQLQLIQKLVDEPFVPLLISMPYTSLNAIYQHDAQYGQTRYEANLSQQKKFMHEKHRWAEIIDDETGLMKRLIFNNNNNTIADSETGASIKNFKMTMGFADKEYSVSFSYENQDFDAFVQAKCRYDKFKLFSGYNNWLFGGAQKDVLPNLTRVNVVQILHHMPYSSTLQQMQETLQKFNDKMLKNVQFAHALRKLPANQGVPPPRDRIAQALLLDTKQHSKPFLDKIIDDNNFFNKNGPVTKLISKNDSDSETEFHILLETTPESTPESTPEDGVDEDNQDGYDGDKDLNDFDLGLIFIRNEFANKPLKQKRYLIANHQKYCDNSSCNRKKYYLNRKNEVIQRYFCVCKKCKSRTYCSRRCQKVDWTMCHRSNCV